MSGATRTCRRTSVACKPFEVVPVKRAAEALAVRDRVGAASLFGEQKSIVEMQEVEGAGGSTWDAAVGVNVTEVHLAALLERPVRLGENSGLVFAEIDDAIADYNANAVGSNTSALQVFDHTLRECNVALVVAKGAGMVLHVSARYLLTKLSLRGSKIM